MSLTNLFKLSKLTITAYKTSGRGDNDKVAPPNELTVQYNPETLSTKHENVVQNTKSEQVKYSYSRSQRLDVDLVFDGTGVDYFGVDLLKHVPSVAERVKEFLRLCYRVQGEVHEPAYLKLTWDKGVLGPSFHCRLKSVDIRYTAFDRDGAPLHAELSAVFLEDIDSKKKALLERLSSPDLTHRRVVREGDTLPLLCREVYGSAKHYIRVAEVNGLDDFRCLNPGQELIFPPFADASRERV